MTPIIDPIPAEVLEQELTKDLFLRQTNKANNEIYVINARNAPNILREIGRLREVTFRIAGAGSGNACDLQSFDIEDDACEQLLVWNPDAKEIIGSYRFTWGNRVTFEENGQPHNNTAHLFHFSDKFSKEYLPYSLEMARAFVQPKYQTAEMGAKSLFALDNLWDGIGGLVALNPQLKYLMGKVSVYCTMPKVARKAIFFYLDKYHGDREQLLKSKQPETFTPEEIALYNEMFPDELTAKDNYKTLNNFVKSHGDKVPPLIHSYIELSSGMVTYGTCSDVDFGDCYDTAMTIELDKIHDNKRARYVESFVKNQI